MKRNKLWKTTNHQKTPTMDTTITVENSTDQLQHQENNKNKELLLESIQNDFIAQSRSLSKVTRLLAGVVIGTIWAICYREKEVDFPNNWLLTSIIFSILFFIIELYHYWDDSRFYHKKSDQIVKSNGDFSLRKIKSEVQYHSKKSYCYLNFKFFVALIFSLTFIVGVGKLYHYNDNTEKMSTTPQVKQGLKSSKINKYNLNK